MSPLETFFTCGFVSTFTAATLATLFRYLPTFISRYRTLKTHLTRLIPE